MKAQGNTDALNSKKGMKIEEAIEIDDDDDDDEDEDDNEYGGPPSGFRIPNMTDNWKKHFWWHGAKRRPVRFAPIE